MVSEIKSMAAIAREYSIPAEDVFLIDLNLSGVVIADNYSRTRFALRMTALEVFQQAHKFNSFDYYLALPVRRTSPYKIEREKLSLGDVVLGHASGVTEDFCDQNYPRRNGTVLNLNPNCRTSCRGCHFCYTNYQTPRDRKKLLTRADLKTFFRDYVDASRFPDLSHLIQIAVVTGCFDGESDVVNFVKLLREVSCEFGFKGEIFYLGSQVKTPTALSALTDAAPFAICFSVECFENRELLLRDKKRDLQLELIPKLLDYATSLGMKANFSYVLGLDPLDVLNRHFRDLCNHVSAFPIINLLQLHSHHRETLRVAEANDFSYYLKARKVIEGIFDGTKYRPRTWENYRGLWYLSFASKPLNDIRTPHIVRG